MKWNDEYWPLLIQLYKKKPKGVKPLYAHDLVDIALKLHITPQLLQQKMQELQQPDTPFLKRLCEKYRNTHKLDSDADTLLTNQGYGTAGKYYDNIETNNSWELDFLPLQERPELTPAHLIIILSVYFQLTPSTMVKETEEVKKTAKFLKLTVDTVLQVMEVFQNCDPYLGSSAFMIDPLFFPCKDVWERFDGNTAQIENTATQLAEYFK